MKAGQLRHYVSLYSRSTTAGSKGQATGSDTLVAANIPAAIQTLNGRELEIAKQLFAMATHQLTIRYLAGVQPGMYATWNENTYYVGFVNDVDNRHFELRLLAGTNE